MDKYTVNIRGKTLIAQDTYEVTFSRPKGFTYQAGQYIDVSLCDTTLPLRENHRSFSLSSSPLDTAKLTTAMRLTDSIFKKKLLSLPSNSIVEITGPFGHFLLPKNQKIPLIFLAGGIGITPFMSMLRSLPKNPIILINSNSTKERQAFSKELESVKKTLPNFIFFEKIQRMTWKYVREKIRITPELLWYIAGPKLMVNDTRTILIQNGVQPDSILPESFTGYETI